MSQNKIEPSSALYAVRSLLMAVNNIIWPEDRTPVTHTVSILTTEYPCLLPPYLARHCGFKNKYSEQNREPHNTQSYDLQLNENLEIKLILSKYCTALAFIPKKLPNSATAELESWLVYRLLTLNTLRNLALSSIIMMKPFKDMSYHLPRFSCQEIIWANLKV